MKVTYTSGNGRLAIEFDCETGKAAFACIAAVQELFEEPDCGCCGSANIRCDVREFDGNQYYKLACNACGAQLDFGQHKNGKSLFVKRWDKEKNRPLPNRGWYVWQGSRQSSESNTSHESPDSYNSF